MTARPIITAFYYLKTAFFFFFLALLFFLHLSKFALLLNV